MGLFSTSVERDFSELSVGSVREAIRLGKAHLAQNRSDIFTVKLSGVNDWSGEPNDGSDCLIDFRGVESESGKGLVLDLGGGTIIKPRKLSFFRARNLAGTFRITNGTLQSPFPEFTQGRVVSVKPFTVRVGKGYPSPLDIYDDTPDGHAGRWLSRFLDDGTSSGEGHIRWSNPRYVGGAWELAVDRSVAHFAPGSRFSLTSKDDGSAFDFHGGALLKLDRLTFVNDARGIFRYTDQPQVVGNTVKPRRGALLSTGSGGFQLYGVKNAYVARNFLSKLGDDATAWFEGATGLMENNTYVGNRSGDRVVVQRDAPEVGWGEGNLVLNGARLFRTTGQADVAIHYDAAGKEILSR